MRAMILIALTAVAVLAVGLLFGGSYVLSALSDYSGNERAIVEHYPHSQAVSLDSGHLGTSERGVISTQFGAADAR